MTVTGSVDPLRQPIVPTPIDASAAMLQNDNQQIPFTSEGRYPLNEHGQFELLRRERVELEPGTYHFRSLDLARLSTLHILGETVIYVEKRFDAGRGAIVAEPGDLEIMAMGNQVMLSAYSDMHARVYAPNAMIERRGRSHCFGSLFGRRLYVLGLGGIHAEVSPSTGVEDSFTLEWEYAD